MSPRWTVGDLYNNLCGYDCCDRCTSVAAGLKKFFVNTATNVCRNSPLPKVETPPQRALYLTLSAPCTFLPGRTTCRKNAQERVDNFFNGIAEKLDEADFCQKLPCCGRTFGDLSIPKSDCLVCRLEAKMINSAIEKGDTQQEVIDQATNLCSKLPTLNDLRDRCTDFVNDRYNELYPAVKANPDDNAKACQALGYCIKNANIFGCTGEPVDSCTTCVEAMDSFHDNVSSFTDGTTSALQRICDKLGPFSGPCTSLVTGAIPKVVSGVQSFFNANRVCRVVKYC